MSTRGILVVKKNGKTKVAQYNRCDSYPTWVGKRLSEFFAEKDRVVRMVQNLDNCSFITVESEPEQGALKTDDYENDREILDYIADTKGDIYLRNNEAFGEDTLFCEWTWTIEIITNGDEIQNILLNVTDGDMRKASFDMWADIEDLPDDEAWTELEEGKVCRCPAISTTYQ